MQKYIILGIIIVAIFLLITYSDYVRYFFLLLKGEIKHNKKLRKLMKGNIKKRLLKNKEIKEYAEYAKNSLAEKQYQVKDEFILRPDLERKLKYSRFDDKSVIELIKDIFEYLGLDYSQISFNIKRTSSRTKTCIAGTYNKNEKSITIEISTYITLDQIVAILAHESSHHILNSNSIVLKKTSQNEILTDITAIYLGFGKYFSKAYKDKRRIIYEGEFLELVDADKLGYIAYGDVNYANRYCKKIKRSKVLQI